MPFWNIGIEKGSHCSGTRVQCTVRNLFVCINNFIKQDENSYGHILGIEVPSRYLRYAGTIPVLR